MKNTAPEKALTLDCSDVPEPIICPGKNKKQQTLTSGQDPGGIRSTILKHGITVKFKRQYDS